MTAPFRLCVRWPVGVRSHLCSKPKLANRVYLEQRCKSISVARGRMDHITNENARCILADVESLHEYIAGQHSRGRPPSDDLLAKQARQFVIKIERIRGELNASDAQRLSDGFDVEGLFTPAQQNTIGTAISTRITNNNSSAGASKKETRSARKYHTSRIGFRSSSGTTLTRAATTFRSSRCTSPSG